jgi:hypothetical protein
MPCADVDRLARKHLADIQERIVALQRMASELTQTVDACAGGVRARCAILGNLQSPLASGPKSLSAPTRRRMAGR